MLDPSENTSVEDPAAQIEKLSRQVELLTELSTTGFRLSHLLRCHELYAAFAETVGSKLGTENVALYVHEKKERMLRLAYQQGADVSTRLLSLDDHSLFKRLMQKEMLTRASIEADPVLKQFFDARGLDWQDAGIWIPLSMQHDLVGLVRVGLDPERLPEDDNTRRFIEKICVHAAVCIHNCRLYEMREKEKEDLDRTLYNLSLLYDIGRAMTHISDLKSLLKYILNQAIAVTHAEKGSIMLHDPDTDRLSIRVLAGLDDKVYQARVNNNEITCRSFLPGEGVAGRVFQSGEAVFINETGGDSSFVEAASSFVQSIACIPMHVYNETIGVINVTNKKNKAGFIADDIEMLSAVADQAAVSISKAQLWEMAVNDSLTGLHVRRYFMVRLQEEVSRTERYEKTLSVVMADLDHFKAINDTFGHTAGDQVLKAVGEYLHTSIRDVDCVGRYGGEEFVLLLPETDKASAQGLSERLRKGIAAMQPDNLPDITISMGIATFPEDGRKAGELLQKADAALYAAKRKGRNRVIGYTNAILWPDVNPGAAKA
ncbi:MAG: sensor domain-containing diguanylate cyclase [Thermodesulfobacteriota bacterium]